MTAPPGVVLTLANSDRIYLPADTPGLSELVSNWTAGVDGGAVIVGGLTSERHGALAELHVRYDQITQIAVRGAR